MTRREKRVFAAMLVATSVIPSVVMVGMRLLGARDELTAILVVGAFAFTVLGGSYLFDDDPPPDRR